MDVDFEEGETSVVCGMLLSLKGFLENLNTSESSFFEILHLEMATNAPFGLGDSDSEDELPPGWEERTTEDNRVYYLK